MRKKYLNGLVFLLLLCSIFLCYSSSLPNPFIWDDEALVCNNPLIRNWRLLPRFFVSDLYFNAASGSNFYRPVQALTYLLDYSLWKLNPWGYHLTNILLQALVSWLVFLLLKKLGQNLAVSFAGALLFALSPIHTEAVAYISGRAEMLLGVFLISSLIFFIKYLESGAAKFPFLLLSLFFFALGILSKELAMVFPLSILAFAFYFYPEKLKDWRGAVKNILPFALIFLIYAALRLTILHFPTARAAELAKFSFGLRVSALPHVILTYINILILPINLHMSREMSSWVGLLQGLPGKLFLIALFGVSIYLLFFRRDKKIAAFLYFWFLLFFLPQSGLLPLNAFISEHFIYLSSISFYAGMANLSFKILKKKAFFIFLTGLALFYGILTYGRNFEWRDPVIFYKRIIKLSPRSFMAHNNLGTQYEKAGDFAKAILEYKKALEIEPVLLEAHSNLANAYFKTGQYQEAEREFQIVEKITPLSKAAEVENNIGNLYEKEKNFDEALSRYRRALKLNPALSFAHFNIARVYFFKNIDLASEEILQSLSALKEKREERIIYLEIIKEHLLSLKEIGCAFSFYNNLGVKLANASLLGAAEVSFKKSLEIAPDFADAHFNLAVSYLKQGLKGKAIAELRLAARINPRHKANALLRAIRKNSAF